MVKSVAFASAFLLSCAVPAHADGEVGEVINLQSGYNHDGD